MDADAAGGFRDREQISFSFPLGGAGDRHHAPTGAEHETLFFVCSRPSVRAVEAALRACRWDRICWVETFISTTMNGKVHQSLNQNLHDWKKCEKFAVNANVPGQELFISKRTKPQVEGFIIAIMNPSSPSSLRRPDRRRASTADDASDQRRRRRSALGWCRTVVAS
jgi:hypothetical protein